jgi:RES domain-containing protein
MIVFRLSKEKHARDLSGKGAELYGGRWNSKGTPMLYTSASRALAVTEIAVHTPLGNVPADYCIITLDLPEFSILEFEESKLVPDWNKFPYTRSTQLSGDQFIAERKSLALKVPSAVVQGDYNYLVNPKHEYIIKVLIVQVEKFEFDRRLFKTGSAI